MRFMCFPVIHGFNIYIHISLSFLNFFSIVRLASGPHSKATVNFRPIAQTSSYATG